MAAANQKTSADKVAPVQRPAPPKATLVRKGADFWRIFNLDPLTKIKPDE